MEGLAETGRVSAIDNERADPGIAVKPGEVMIGVDERYYRPAEVDSLLGDPSQAKDILGRQPASSLDEMIAEMVASDLTSARKNRLLLQKGFEVNQTRE